MSAIVCEHGQLARSCNICELQAEINRLTAENERLKEELVRVAQFAQCMNNTAVQKDDTIYLAHIKDAYAFLHKENERLQALSTVHIERIRVVEGERDKYREALERIADTAEIDADIIPQIAREELG